MLRSLASFVGERKPNCDASALVQHAGMSLCAAHLGLWMVLTDLISDKIDSWWRRRIICTSTKRSSAATTSSPTSCIPRTTGRGGSLFVFDHGCIKGRQPSWCATVDDQVVDIGLGEKIGLFGKDGCYNTELCRWQTNESPRRRLSMLLV